MRETFVNAKPIAKRHKAWLVNLDVLSSDFKSSITKDPDVVARTKPVAVSELVAANEPPHSVRITQEVDFGYGAVVMLKMIAGINEVNCHSRGPENSSSLSHDRSN